MADLRWIQDDQESDHPASGLLVDWSTGLNPALELTLKAIHGFHRVLFKTFVLTPCSQFKLAKQFVRLLSIGIGIGVLLIHGTMVVKACEPLSGIAASQQPAQPAHSHIGVRADAVPSGLVGDRPELRSSARTDRLAGESIAFQNSSHFASVNRFGPDPPIVPSELSSITLTTTPSTATVGAAEPWEQAEVRTENVGSAATINHGTASEPQPPIRSSLKRADTATPTGVSVNFDAITSTPARSMSSTPPSPVDDPLQAPLTSMLPSLAESWVEPSQLAGTIRTLLTLGVLSLAPAIVLMTTSFVRIAVVFGILRQALGIQQLPSNQVLTSISLFMTFLIMAPVWSEVYKQSIVPYSDPATKMTLEEAWQAGIRPVRHFMSHQIDMAGNGEDIWLFYEYLPKGQPEPRYYDDVPLEVLLPAFMLSELKTAFLIGFQIYLPFLVLDLVVASVTISMGMFMLPPSLISLPFKLLLFVLVDGWRLVVGMLLESFAPL